MTRNEKAKFIAIAVTVGILFLAVIAGGIIFVITEHIWPLICSIICFIGFGLSFPVIGHIKRISSFRAIERSLDSIESLAVITSVAVGYQSYRAGMGFKAVTLDIKCDINGKTSRGWYKFSNEELKYIEAKRMIESGSTGADTHKVYYRYEVNKDSLDRKFRIGDKIIVKYIVNKPKYCIILGKQR